jgi:hypothetical protein
LAASLAFLNAALKLAGNLGDRHHQADLLWHHAIRHAEFGQRGAQRGQGTLS